MVRSIDCSLPHQSLLINSGTIDANSKLLTTFRIIVYAQVIEKLPRPIMSKFDKAHYWVGEYFQITGLINISNDFAGRRIPHIVLRETAQMKLISKIEADNLLKLLPQKVFSTMYS